MVFEAVVFLPSKPTTELMWGAVCSQAPDSSVLEYADGTVQFMDPAGEAFLSVFPARPISDATEVGWFIAQDAPEFAFWLDVVIPDPMREKGVRAAACIAVGLHGTMRYREATD